MVSASAAADRTGSVEVATMSSVDRRPTRSEACSRFDDVEEIPMIDTPQIVQAGAQQAAVIRLAIPRKEIQ